LLEWSQYNLTIPQRVAGTQENRLTLKEVLKMYDLQENVRNQIIAVGTDSVLLSTAHKRNEITITNTSAAAQVVTISFGNEAAAGAGVVLQPNSVYFASNTVGFNVYQGDIYIIANGAAGQVSIFER